jgi:uncharacterized protein Veg
MLRRMMDRILCRPSGAYEFVLYRSINITLLLELLSIRQIFNYVFQSRRDEIVIDNIRKKTKPRQGRYKDVYVTSDIIFFVEDFRTFEKNSFNRASLSPSHMPPTT